MLPWSHRVQRGFFILQSCQLFKKGERNIVKTKKKKTFPYLGGNEGAQQKEDRCYGTVRSFLLSLSTRLFCWGFSSSAKWVNRHVAPGGSRESSSFFFAVVELEISQLLQVKVSRLIAPSMTKNNWKDRVVVDRLLSSFYCDSLDLTWERSWSGIKTTILLLISCVARALHWRGTNVTQQQQHRYCCW